MATYVALDHRITINSVNLSSAVRKATLQVSVNEVTDTAMGDTWVSRLGGLRDYRLTVEFNQDFAASQVDATLWPLLGTVVAFTARPTTGAISATNPEYQGSVLITDYTPIEGQVGDLAMFSVTWPGSGPLTRATS
jgi:hypothetical protein